MRISISLAKVNLNHPSIHRMLVISLAHSMFKDFICPVSDFFFFKQTFNNVFFLSLLSLEEVLCLVTIAKTGDTKWKKGTIYMRKNENKNHTPLRGRVWDQVKTVRDESLATLHILSTAWNSGW